MLLSQKCQYALRAVFEVAKRSGEGPIKIEAIAQAQAIPPRFLAAILNQLKQGGFVESRRGSDGGYLLDRPADSLSVGDIIRFVEGPVGPVVCVTGKGSVSCPLRGKCVFMPMWREAQQAMENVYDNTTFQDLMDREALMTAAGQACVPMYYI
ncbi:MAG: Rrf2 family transcriptional regulator [Planctomycetes bacterium RBG_13_63_9]|nr:MAG: Rrf2 family transcriptional regulator [Planctomycetes bacterium RBG_13_63_9]